MSIESIEAVAPSADTVRIDVAAVDGMHSTTRQSLEGVGMDGRDDALQRMSALSARFDNGLVEMMGQMAGETRSFNKAMLQSFGEMQPSLRDAAQPDGAPAAHEANGAKGLTDTFERAADTMMAQARQSAMVQGMTAEFSSRIGLLMMKTKVALTKASFASNLVKTVVNSAKQVLKGS